MKTVPSLTSARSLTTTLALAFFSVSGVALLISVGLSLFSNIQTQQQTISSNQQLIAQDAAKSVSSFIEDKFGVLETTIWFTDLPSASQAEQKDVLDSLLGLQPAFRQLVLLNAQDQPVAQVSRFPLVLGQSVDLLKGDILAQSHQRQRAISSVFIDPVTSEPLVVMAVPVTNVFGDFKGTLVTQVNLKFMWDLVDQLDVGDAGRAYVVDRQGNLIAFGDTGRVLKGENIANVKAVSEFMTHPASAHPSGVSIYQGIMGTIVVGTYVPLVTPDWAVVTELPWEEAYLAVIRETLASIGITFGMAFLAGILGVLLARRLTVPLVNLTETATRIAEGERSSQAMVDGPQEIARLALAFNSMTAQLQQSLESLERQVVEVKRAEDSLRQANETMQAIFDFSPLAILMVSTDSRVKLWNKAAERMYGWTAQEVLGKFLPNVSEEKMEEHLALRQRVNRGESVTGLEVERRRKDGSTLPLNLSVAALKNSSGETYAHVSIAIDITERKRTEDILQRYLLLSQQTRDIILFIRVSDGRILEANEAAAKAYGYERQELMTKHIRDVRAPETRELITGQIDQANTESVLFETLHCRKDGRVFPVEVSSTGISLGGEGVLLSIIRDITERKRAEEALHASIERLGLALDAARAGNWEWDLRTNENYWSEELWKVYGLEPHSCQPSYEAWRQVVHPDDRSTAEKIVQEAASNGTELNYEFRVVDRDGAVRTLLSRGRPLRNANGQVERYIGIVLDITERKQAEATLRQRLAELEAMHTVSAALRTAQTLDEALPIVLDQTLAALETDAGTIWLYHPESGELRVAVNRGGFSELDFAPAKPGEGIRGTVFASGRAYQTTEFARDPLSRAGTVEEIPADWGGACVPIRTTAEAIGVLTVAVPPPRQITPEQMNLLASLAEMAGAALHRMRLFEETTSRLEHLQSLHAIDTVITSSLDLWKTLYILLDHITTRLKVDAAVVLLFQPHLQTLDFAAGRGFRTRTAETTHIRLSDSLAGDAVIERHTVQVFDAVRATAQDKLHFARWAGEGFVAYCAVPLIAKGEVKGVLEIYQRTPLTPGPQWMDFLETFAAQAAIAIDNAQLFENQQRSTMELSLAYDASIEGWSRALELRDRETEGHTMRVAEMTLRLARAVGIDAAEDVHVRRGALLHDIGKMGVPDVILLKPDKLTDEEWAIMRKHPQFAYDMLSPISYLRPALDIPYCHHEKWDGTGYPCGLKGEQIPLTARLFAVVDVWDALRSDRPYRLAWSEEKVREYIREQAGTHFDPKVVQVFLETLAVSPR